MNLEPERPPMHQHHCTGCVYMGHESGYDVYICPSGGRPTILARYSSKGGDYGSGMSFVTKGTFFHECPRDEYGNLRVFEKMPWTNAAAAVLARWAVRTVCESKHA